MRKTWLGLIAVLLSSCAFGATVTYTLSLHENAAGQCAPNAFAIYGSVSQGDNQGFHSFAVDLKTPAQGGATLTTFTNRSPNGTWDVDPNDPDYDPNVAYPTKYGGFNAVRGANINTGVVSGAYDSAKFQDAIKIFGFGQQTGNMNNIHPPPSQVVPGKPVTYGPYAPGTATDVAYGTTGRLDLPDGSLRLATGTWTGLIEPAFDTLSVDNRAILWTDAGGVLSVNPQFRTLDYCASVPEPSAAFVLLAGSLVNVRRRRGARV